LANTRINFGIKLGLTRAQAATLTQLRRPAAIQDYINKIPTNYELKGETNLSVAEAMRSRTAHCLEGAFIAACALWMNGQPPLVINLQARSDDDHAVALYRRGKCWGAISKSNHVWLRWREPVYRTLRELVMSYFHEYVMGSRKTLMAYSAPLDLRRFDPAEWVSGPHSWKPALALANSRHYQLIPKDILGHLRPRDAIEIKAGKLLEHKAPKRAARRDIHFLA
jgi:hypothetical protein